MIFKPLTPTDIPDLLIIEQQATAYPWAEQAFISSFSDNYFGYKLLNQQNRIIGFYLGYCAAAQAELFNICVSPEQQKQGFGKRLLQHFIAQSKTLQASGIWLEVRSSNEPAISLYQQQGFIQTGTRKNYYVNAVGREDAVLMNLDLYAATDGSTEK